MVCLLSERNAKERAMARDISKARMVIESVAGILESTRNEISCPSEATPQLPLKKEERKERYLTAKGSSSPIAFLYASTASSLASSDRTEDELSPEEKEMKEKTARETMSIVSSRRRRRFQILSIPKDYTGKQEGFTA